MKTENKKKRVCLVKYYPDRKVLRFKPKGYANPIELPVITSGSRDKSGAWTWNGDVERPTLRPSIRTYHGDGTESHLWLDNGMCRFLSDSKDGNAGNTFPLEEI